MYCLEKPVEILISLLSNKKKKRLPESETFRMVLTYNQAIGNACRHTSVAQIQSGQKAMKRITESVSDEVPVAT